MKRLALCLGLLALLGCRKSHAPNTIGLALDVGGRGDQSFNDGALRGLEIMAAGLRYTAHGYEPLDDGGYQRLLPPDLSAASFPHLGIPRPLVLSGKAQEDYEPNLAPVEDRAFTSTTGEALAEAAASVGPIGYVLLADGRSMTEAAAGTEITVAYVDLSPYAFEDAEDFNTFPGRTFRCVVDEVASIEANLSIANMDFHEFADSVEADGVFRGFPEE